MSAPPGRITIGAPGCSTATRPSRRPAAARARRRSRPTNASPAPSPTSGPRPRRSPSGPATSAHRSPRRSRSRASRIACSTSVLSDACSWSGTRTWMPRCSTRAEGSSTPAPAPPGTSVVWAGRRRCIRCRRSRAPTRSGSGPSQATRPSRRTTTAQADPSRSTCSTGPPGPPRLLPRRPACTSVIWTTQARYSRPGGARRCASSSRIMAGPSFRERS